MSPLGVPLGVLSMSLGELAPPSAVAGRSARRRAWRGAPYLQVSKSCGVPSRQRSASPLGLSWLPFLSWLPLWLPILSGRPNMPLRRWRVRRGWQWTMRQTSMSWRIFECVAEQSYQFGPPDMRAKRARLAPVFRSSSRSFAVGPGESV